MIPATIIYGTTSVAGIPVRFDSRAVMEKAVEGHAIEVSSSKDYINLYHVFDRMRTADAKRFGGLQLFRQQIGRSRWVLNVRTERGAVPTIALDEGYNPKRGRYKRYAEQLASGDVLTFADRREAVKARRAWQLYVPKGHRKTLIARVRVSGNKFTVSVAARP